MGNFPNLEDWLHHHASSFMAPSKTALWRCVWDRFTGGGRCRSEDFLFIMACRKLGYETAYSKGYYRLERSDVSA